MSKHQLQSNSPRTSCIEMNYLGKVHRRQSACSLEMSQNSTVPSLRTRVCKRSGTMQGRQSSENHFLVLVW